MSEKIKSIKVGTNIDGLYNELSKIVDEIINMDNDREVVEVLLVIDVLITLKQSNINIDRLVHSGSDTEFKPIEEKTKEVLFKVCLEKVEGGDAEVFLTTYKVESDQGISYIVLEMNNDFFWVLELEKNDSFYIIPFFGVMGEA